MMNLKQISILIGLILMASCTAHEIKDHMAACLQSASPVGEGYCGP